MNAKNGMLFVVAAPSGAGKTSLLKELSKKNNRVIISISHTTRKPRDGEIEGEDYFFVDEKSFKKISTEAQNKFDKKAKIFLEHAKGYSAVGEISILIAVGSGHRDEAFKICRYILEEVKHQSPIWKKEHYADGKEEWLPGHSLRPKKEI